MKMQSKYIEFTGLGTSPDDWVSADGELAVCQNLINEDGSLKVLGDEKELKSLGTGDIIYIHKNSDFGIHYIVKVGSQLKYYNEDFSALLPNGTSFGTIVGEFKECSAVGNILIVLSDEEQHRYLWNDGEYLDVENDLPEIDVTFSHSGWFTQNGVLVEKPTVIADCYYNDYTTPSKTNYIKSFCNRPESMRTESANRYIGNYVISWPSYDNEIGEVRNADDTNPERNYPELLTNVAFGELNALIKKATEQGLFVMPRLVRAAWRLYDGTFAKFTTPVLVFNMGTRQPLALEGDQHWKDIHSILFPYTIDYYLKNCSTVINKWGEIIKGITFFAGSDIYDYDSSGSIKTLKRNFANLASTGEGERTVRYSAEIPRFSEGDMLKKLEDGGPFYQIYDKPLEEYSGAYSMLQIRRKVQYDGFGAMASYIVIQSHTIKISFGGQSIQDNVVIEVNVDNRDNIDRIYDKIVDALRVKRSKIKVHKMYVSNRMLMTDGSSSKSYPYEIGISFIAPYGVEISSIATYPYEGASESMQNTYLDMFAVNSKGEPLPSDKLPLATLETQTSINDDYLQHVKLLPGTINAYNQRLNMASLTVKYDGYKITANNVPSTRSGYNVSKVYYYVKTSTGDKIVRSDLSTPVETMLNFMYYPDSRCYKAVVVYKKTSSDATNSYLELPMKKSNTLNGAVFASSIPNFSIKVETTIGEEPSEKGPSRYVFDWNVKGEIDRYAISTYVEPTSTANKGTELLDNVILVTDAKNPFNWNANMECSVGNGKVLAIAPNTQALSQGQFGSHPAYAFTESEGVWALSVNAEGKYESVQAVTRDCILDKKSICQLDNSLMFATARGLMELQGSQAQCVSDKLVNSSFDLSSLQGWSTIRNLAGFTDDEIPEVRKDFKEFIKNCQISYDYINQRAIVFNPEESYAYVFSFKGKQWSTISSNLVHNLNSYPEALCVAKNGTVLKLVDLSSMGLSTDSDDDDSDDDASDEVTTVSGVMVTRPIKLESPNVMKTLYHLVHRGKLHSKDAVKFVLYGSRDLYEWVVVGSSKSYFLNTIGGTPYKYFVLAIVSKMTEEDALHGVEVTYRDKYVNRLR